MNSDCRKSFNSTFYNSYDINKITNKNMKQKNNQLERNVDILLGYEKFYKNIYYKILSAYFFKNMQIFKNIRPNLNECFSGRMELMEEIKSWARYLVSLSSLWELSKLACFDIRPRVSPIIQFVLKLDRKKDN